MTLTPREIQVYDLVMDGLNAKEVARYLNLSLRTIKFHLNNIFRKYEVSSMQKLVVKHYKRILDHNPMVSSQ